MAAVSTFLEFTPPPKTNKTQGHKEDETPLFLVLAPFNPPAKIFFEETKLNEARTKSVIIRNPTSKTIEITFDKLPEPDSGLTLSETAFTVEACSQVALVVNWQAVKLEGFRHVIHVKDSNKNKKISEIIVTGTCVSPVKRNDRAGVRKQGSLRAKVLTNRVTVTSPKVKLRVPLRSRAAANTVGAEDNFVSQERKTHKAEDKENVPSERRKKANGFRETAMEPPPTFDSHRKRKAPQAEIRLEVTECFQDSEPQSASPQPSRHSMRRSTYSLNSPGSNSLLSIAQQLSTEHQNEPTPLEPLRENSVPKRVSLNRLSVNSVDGGYGPSDLSPGPSFRDSLDSNPRSCISVSSFDRDSLEAVTSPPSNVPAQNKSLQGRNRPSSARNSLTADKPKSSSPYNTRSKELLITSGTPNSGRRSQGSILSPSEPAFGLASELPPVEFSPNFDLKRCTFVKSVSSEPSVDTGTPRDLSYTIIDDCDETLNDLILKTPQLATPCSVRRRSTGAVTRSQQATEIDLSSPIYGYDLQTPEIETPAAKKRFLEVSKDSAPSSGGLNISGPNLDFNLKTPKFETPRNFSMHTFDTLKAVPDSASKVGSGSDSKYNHKLKAEKMESPCMDRGDLGETIAANNVNTSSKAWEITTPGSCKLKTHKNEAFTHTKIKGKSSSAYEFLNSAEILSLTSPTCSYNLRTPQLKTPCSTRKRSVNEITHTPMDVLDLGEPQDYKLKTPKVRQNQSNLGENVGISADNQAVFTISPPKKSKIDTTQVIEEPKKPKQNVAFARASSSSAKQAISPTARVKRLAAARKSATPRSKFIEPKEAATKRPVSILKEAPKPAKHYSGVPMALLKLKPKIRRSVTMAKVEDKPNQDQPPAKPAAASFKECSEKPLNPNLNRKLLRSSTCLSLKKSAPKTPSENMARPKMPRSKSTFSVKDQTSKPESNLVQNRRMSRSATSLSVEKLPEKSLSEELKELSRSSSAVFLRKPAGQKFSNPDQYIKSLSQPADYLFLYAATSKVDPFMTNSLYYDPEWLDRQEADLIKWLNSLLTPPTELNSDSAGHWCVDVAALWKKSQSQKLELALSKEVVSSRYLTNTRLDVVRKAAGTLFRTEMAPVLSKLAVCISKQIISVRKDRDLHLDFGLQRNILRLLLCYNPLWLRIGLETVYGCRIPLISNSDVVGLTTFIRKRLLSDNYLRKKHSHPMVPSLYLPSFGDEMKKFILQKFFMLVYFLDQAKTQKLIGHDPCLFVTNSPFKSSNDIVVEFAKELIAGLGDITKYLKSFGYVLHHKQKYLDEFNYAVVNRQDLRDGVRLTRVMEIILTNHSLSAKLRTPAISRLQKVHNVDVALKALEGAGYEIQGDIKSKDIVDGHREKTLSLLWQIIYKFQAPRYEKAAKKLQDWWRSNSLRFTIQRRIRARRLAKQNAAAVKIQALWRGVSMRCKFAALQKQLLQERDMRRNAAIVLQKHWRRYTARRNYRRQLNSILQAKNNAATVLQKHWRRHVVQRMFQKLIVAERGRRENAAVVLQKHWRRHIAQERFKKQIALAQEARNAAAVVIQKNWRRNQAQKKYQELLLAIHKRRNEAAVVLQKHWRRFVAQKSYQKQVAALQKARNDAAISIQKNWRRYVARKSYRNYVMALKERRNKAAVVVQKHWRRYVAQKCYQRQIAEIRESRNNAAVIIQKHWRRYAAQKIYWELQSALQEKKNNAAIILQKHWRRYKAQKNYQQLVLELKKARNAAAIVIQKNWRRYFKQKRYQEYLAALQRKRNEAAVVIQKQWRRCMAQKRYKQLLAQIQAARNTAAVVIQKHWRRFAAEKRYHKHLAAVLERRNEAAVMLQKHWRRYAAQRNYRCQLAERKRINNAAIVLQKHWKRYVAQKNYREQLRALREARNKAAVVLQKHWRRYVAQKTYKRMLQLEFERLNGAAVVLQKHWKRYVAQKRYREQLAMIYTARNNAAVVIQKNWRRYNTQKSYRLHLAAVRAAKNHAATIIQKNWRRYIAQKRYQCLVEAVRQMRTNAAIVLQRNWRRFVAMRNYQNQLLAIRTARNNATIVLQKHWRRHLAEREYKHQQAAVQKIQKWWRRKKVLPEHEEFLRKRMAVAIIQRYYRATKIARRICQNYRQLKSAAVVIQSRFRANRAMRVDRAAFLKLRAAVVTLQTHWRANQKAIKTREQYLQLKRAVLFLERKYHAKKIGNIERENYIVLKAAAVCIQRRYRAKKLTEKCRKDYTQVRNAAISIQARYRALKRMKAEQACYVQLKSAALILQTRWRKILAAREARKDYLRLRRTVVWVQQKWRGKKLVSEAVARYRAMLDENKKVMAERFERERIQRAATKIQATWRGYQTRKQVKLPKKTASKSLQLCNAEELAPQKGQTLQNRYDLAMSQIYSSSSDLQELILAYMNLDTITYLSPKLCEELVSGELIQITYFHLVTANRSVPYQELCVACLRVLMNLTRFHNTAAAVWEETKANKGINTLLCFLRAYHEKNTSLFCHAATLLWLFASDPEKLDVLRRDELFSKILKFVYTPLQKKSLKSAPKKKPHCKASPSRTADWGLGNSPREFSDAFVAVSLLCQQLNVKV